MRVKPGLVTTLVLLVAVAAALADSARAGDEKRAIDVIENDLVADDAAVRAKAAAELADRFPDGAVAVPMLVDLLDDQSPEVVAVAARAIDAMAVDSVQHLLSLLNRDADWNSDSKALRRLALDFQNSPTTIGYRPDADPMSLARLALHDTEGIAETAVELAPILRGTSKELSRAAAAVMAMHAADVLIDHELGPYPLPRRALVASTAVAMVRKDVDPRSCIGSRLIERLRPADRVVVGELTKALTTDKKPYGDTGRQAPRTPPPFDQKEQYTTWRHDSKIAACRALGAIGPAAASAAPALLEILGDRHQTPSMVRACVRSLVRMKRQSDVVALFKRNCAGSSHYARAFAEALAENRCGAPDVIAFVLGSQRNDVSIHCLRHFGTDAMGAVPELQRLSQAIESSREALFYADTILAISPSDAVALRLIDRTLQDTHHDLRDGALAILGARAATLDRVLELLADAARREAHGNVPLSPSDAVIDGLARFGPRAAGTVPDLLLLMDVGKHRRQVVAALGRIVRNDEVVSSRLAALVLQGDETIRVPAAQALRRIRAAK